MSGLEFVRSGELGLRVGSPWLAPALPRMRRGSRVGAFGARLSSVHQEDIGGLESSPREVPLGYLRAVTIPAIELEHGGLFALAARSELSFQEIREPSFVGRQDELPSHAEESTEIREG